MFLHVIFDDEFESDVNFRNGLYIYFLASKGSKFLLEIPLIIYFVITSGKLIV